MQPGPLLLWVLAYLGLLLAVAAWTSRRADDAAFYVGSRNSPWPLVAFGMIGTSLSGVTFVSVPGAVGRGQFSYLQLVIGQVLGYAVVAAVLLPQYHRRGLVSIYGYLGQRLGPAAQRTGAAIFLVARTLGATARLYLVVRVLQDMILDAYGVPFWFSAALVLLMTVLYTLQGGVRTIVFTDTLQTGTMLLGLAVCTALLLQHLGLSLPQGLAALQARGLSRVWRTDPMAADYFGKQLVAGLFIAIAMTGLDQEMMQKSLSVRRLRGAQANLLVLGVVMVGVVTLFLLLGGLLVLAAQAAPAAGLPAAGDRLFPAVVLQLLPAWVQVLFVIALVSALLPSADGALTALTACTCIDLLRLPERRCGGDAGRRRIRHGVHAAYALLFMALLMGFRALDDPSMIGLVLQIAAYTYGPLLGLFAFALVGRRRPPAAGLVAVVLAAPLLCRLIDAEQARLFGAWRIGLELLVLNGALTFAGLWLVSRRANASP